jgi:uncharacterized protein
MFRLRPKDASFFDLFMKSARLVHHGSCVLKDVMQDFIDLQENMDLIFSLEHEADDVNDAIIDKLNQTFITPLDREDIYSLANRLDDVVDFLQGIMERMILYSVGKPSPGAVELARLLVDCTSELVKAFDFLSNIRGNQVRILDCTRTIVSLESDGDSIYRKEVARLFSDCKDPLEIMKWKEILALQEDALDHCEHIGDLLRGVVMKYA